MNKQADKRSWSMSLTLVPILLWRFPPLGRTHQEAKPLLFPLKIMNFKEIQRVALIWMSENIFTVSLMLLILQSHHFKIWHPEKR